MRKSIAILIGIGLLWLGCTDDKSKKKIPENNIKSERKVKELQHPKPPGIQVLDESLKNVIDLESKLEILAEGFIWSEGPLWIEEEQFLLFSDIPDNIVYQWSEKNGLKEYLNPSGFSGPEGEGGKEKGSNGLVLNQQNELILMQHGDRRVARMNASLNSPKTNYISITDNYQGKRFNSPNDGAFHQNGDLYFTDPPYGLSDGYDESPRKELSFNGVYKVDQTGKVTLLDSTLTRPNGIAFSPDYKKLYVSNSDPKLAIWKVYDVNEQGNLSNGNVFYDATSMVGEENKGLPDGLKINRDGYLFATGPGGVLIFSAEGNHLGTINTGKATANCGFNPDQTVLFITAHSQLMRLKLKQ